MPQPPRAPDGAPQEPLDMPYHARMIRELATLQGALGHGQDAHGGVPGASSGLRADSGE